LSATKRSGGNKDAIHAAPAYIVLVMRHMALEGSREIGNCAARTLWRNKTRYRKSIQT